MGLDAIFDRQNWRAVPFHFWTVVFFVLGCIVGSFLNVCIHRMPRGESVVSPPSHCPHCNYSIPWFLNLPLVTWLYLRGRCANCGSPIAVRYFLVELLTGAGFASCWLVFGNPLGLLPSAGLTLAYCLVLAGFIVATVIDFEHFIIPDEITLGGVVAGFLFSALLPELHGAQTAAGGLARSAAGIVVGWGLLYAVVLGGKLMFGRKDLQLAPDSRLFFMETALRLPGEEISYGDLLYRKSDRIQLRAATVEMADRCYWNVELELSRDDLRIGSDHFQPDRVTYLVVTTDRIVLPREAMGFGDVKFMAAIGAFLGWPAVLFSLVVSSFVGAAAGLALIALRQRDRSSQIPYGPYIALAATIWIFFGRQILGWWLRF